MSSETSVWLYVPNLIGYARVIFAIASFVVIYDNPWWFFVFYSLSAWLDIADGYAARALDQCSRFGAILDMVTDRASTTCLIVVLSQFFPKYTHVFLFLIALDLVSHFAHIISSLSRGVKSHKDVTEKQSWLLRMYYTSRLVLGFLCFGNEGFFIGLYCLKFWKGILINLGPLGSSPLGQLLEADIHGNIGLFSALTFLFFFPIMFVKQFINLVQLKQAFVDMVELDGEERKARRKLTTKKN